MASQDRTRREHTISRIRFFTRTQLSEANTLARKRGYNRQLEPTFIASLPQFGRFPVGLGLLHEHANGTQVPAHARCVITVGYDADNVPVQVMLDVDLALFNSLDSLEVTSNGR